MKDVSNNLVPLKRAAFRLYRSLGKSEGELLEILRTGELIAVARVPTGRPSSFSIDRAYWVKLQSRKFKVRRKLNGTWTGFDYTIPGRYLVERPLAILSKLGRAVAANDAKLAPPPDDLALAGLDANLLQTPDWSQIGETAVTTAAGWGAIKKQRLEVFIASVDLERYLKSRIVPSISPRGAKRHAAADQLWILILQQYKIVGPDDSVKVIANRVVAQAKAENLSKVLQISLDQIERFIGEVNRLCRRNAARVLSEKSIPFLR